MFVVDVLAYLLRKTGESFLLIRRIVHPSCSMEFPCSKLSESSKEVVHPSKLIELFVHESVWIEAYPTWADVISKTP